MRRGAAAQHPARAKKASDPEVRERRRAHLGRAKKLLEERGVPFDPETLLEPDWRKRLAPAFDKMPEMWEERRAEEQARAAAPDARRNPHH